MTKIFSSRLTWVIFFIVALVSVIFLALTSGKGADAQNISTCTDSDSGSDYFIKGTAIESVNPIMQYIDMCGGGSSTIPSGHELIEWNCDDNGRVINEYYNCQGGCQDGACMAYYDTDGKDYFTKGTTFFKESVHDTEACLNGIRKEPEYRINKGPYLFEIWVERGVVQSEAYKCPNGCSDGACLKESAAEEEPSGENLDQTKKMIESMHGMNDFLRAVILMEKTFKQIAKDGIATPSDFAQTAVRAKELSPEIMKFRGWKAEDVSDEDVETLTNNMNEICEIGVTLTEWVPEVPQFLELGAKMKQMLKDLKKAQSAVKSAARVAARSKFNIADKADELNGAIEALKVMLDDATASTDFEEKDWKMNEFYDRFQDIYDTIGFINALQNTAKAKVEWGKTVKANIRTISQLERTEADVSELTAKNDEVKAKVDELTIALVKKPIDREEIKWIFEDLKTLESEFVDIADQLRGTKSSLPKLKAVKFDTSQFKNFNVFDQFCGVPVQDENL